MAEKGARTQLEPVARQMYIDGQTLSAIADSLGVSRNSLTEWKARTKSPNDDLDEWDKARQRKSTFGLRMESLLERELTYAEERQPGAIEGVTLDNLSKLGALVVKFKQVEATGTGFDRAKVFLENLQFIAGWMQENDMDGLKVLAESFDSLTSAFKESINGVA
jgi:hypothetical protein